MFCLATSNFKNWAYGLAIIETRWCKFDFFFGFRCKSTRFNFDYHVICEAILVKQVWRMRKSSTVVSGKLDLDKTRCCCYVGAISCLLESKSSRSNIKNFKVKSSIQLLCLTSTFDCPAVLCSRTEKQITLVTHCLYYLPQEF